MLLDSFLTVGTLPSDGGMKKEGEEEGEEEKGEEEDEEEEEGEE